VNIFPNINNFYPITLSEMDDVKLMNRSDTKFVFHYSKLQILLEKMVDYYKILDINDERIHQYKSLYLDSFDRKFYLDHHNERVNRNKIRFRTYVGSNTTFLEVKLKNNKGKTIKKRIKVKEIPKKISKQHKDFIINKIGFDLDLDLKQWINFSRMTFVHKTIKERLTMDINLNFVEGNKIGNLKDLVIAEVKQDRMTRKSDFIRIAKEMKISPFRLSKYCISSIFLDPNLKMNRFKNKILHINNLKNN
tara:strand:+ start:35596 stop:36342 length:747 start_codon:yes stop_codon:yes gene_type:complete